MEGYFGSPLPEVHQFGGSHVMAAGSSTHKREGTTHKREKNVKNLPGRPTVLTPDVVSILISSFHGGMNIREACWQSGISHEAYYSRLREDEQFADIMTRAQAVPTMNARRVIVAAINSNDVGAAKWWLERKAADEFGRNAPSIDEPEPKVNRFATMSDDELNRLGMELSHLIENDKITPSY